MSAGVPDIRNRQHRDAEGSEQARRSGPEQRPGHEAALRNTDDHQIRADVIDGATDLCRGIADEDARVNRGVSVALHRNSKSQTPQGIAQHWVLGLVDPVAVQVRRHAG